MKGDGALHRSAVSHAKDPSVLSCSFLGGKRAHIFVQILPLRGVRLTAMETAVKGSGVGVRSKEQWFFFGNGTFSEREFGSRG